jgi:alpha-glucosidase
MIRSIRCAFFVAFLSLAVSTVRADPPWTIGALTDGKIDVTRGGDVFEISFPSENIVELHYKPNRQTGPHTPVLTDYKGPGATVTTQTGATSSSAVYSTSKLSVAVAGSFLSLKISDATGKQLCELTEWVPEGFTVKHDHHHFFGTQGQVWAGFQGISGGPFVWTTAGYGLLWDSDGGGVDCGDTKTVIRRRAGTEYPRPDFDCYFIAGSPRDIFAAEADLSGHAPLFPKWSLGYMVSRWGVDEKEELANVDLFRQKQIPFDTYITDYDWFNYGKDELGDFEWNTDKFPEGPSGKFCADLAAKGAKWVGIRKPRISSPLPSKMVDGLEAKGWILPPPNGQDKNTKEFNFHIQAARDWWWAHEKPLFESGIAGYWNDEADVVNNFHFMEMVRTEYDGQRSDSNKRVWTLNRNFYTGSQKYAYGMWSGDIQTGFPSMAKQRARMLDTIDNGEAWWSMDAGGFAGAVPTPESYARWVEFAAFVPIMRCHAATPQKREPWNYGDQAEAVAKKYIQLRYQLQPYLYSGAWQVSRHGLPLVRPMWFDYGGDPNVNYLMNEQWMVGDYLLARPIVEQGQNSARIYLPRGTWIDYWTGERRGGPAWIERGVDAGTWQDIPLYVARGAIIPTAPPMLYTGEKPLDPLTVEIYPDAAPSSFTYYDDDGTTYDYEKSVYAEIPMKTHIEAPGMVFEIGAQKGTFALPTKTAVFRIHLLDDKRTVQGVTVSGQAWTQADSATALETKDAGWALDKDGSGPVVIIKSRMGPQRVEVTLK